MSYGNAKIDMYCSLRSRGESRIDALNMVCKYYDLDANRRDQLLTAISEL